MPNSSGSPLPKIQYDIVQRRNNSPILTAERIEDCTIMMYAILCSRETDNVWAKVVELLKQKYELKWPGKVEKYVYDGNALESCLPQLRETRPAYCCVVARHSECTPDLVHRVHRLVREIDESNPFGDAVWGILTGSNEEDVLFSVRQEALVVRRVLGGTSVDLAKVESGAWYNEGKACNYHYKKRGGSATQGQCPQDTTKILVDLLSEKRDVAADTGVDMMITSGHATENDWQIGYRYKNGQFRCPSGQLVGIDREGKTHQFQHSGSPKLLSAAGNCYMGLIRKPHCMALAWMHSIGVVQMTGYLVGTWYGYMGWGVHNYFFNPGMYSFSESFFANNQALIEKLNGEIQGLSGEDQLSGPSRDCQGLLYDKDNVAFYGDPAYDARLLAQPDLCSYSFDVTELPVAGDDRLDEGWRKFSLTVAVRKKISRPPIYLFPSSARDYKLLEGDAVVTCRFVLIRLTHPVNPPQLLTVLYAVKL